MGSLWYRGSMCALRTAGSSSTCVQILATVPPARKLLPRVRKPNLHSDRGQDSNLCAWRPLRPKSTHGSTVPRRLITEEVMACLVSTLVQF
ncbi:hypothetical protein E2C01_035159 [Portunus trituberculatus]|uniref:Uncharacterized protein n=1 Tax=Portunus trituberculatus TaxID=210409 RepID=A0A5B7F2F8_PORTR|nr:hypothetical protein [Portunus trituberculatus]